MLPLPKAPFAGRLFRLKSDESFESTAKRAAAATNSTLDIQPVEGTKWYALWLCSDQPLISGGSMAQELDGVFSYPLLLRAVNNRILLIAKESAIVSFLFEHAGISGLIDSPRIQVDRFARDLILPGECGKNCSPGRKYIIGSIYAAVEGYGRALRSISFFGDDLAEADLVRKSLNEIAVTRIGIRDPRVDKDLLSISSVGEADIRFRGASQLNAIDQLTSHMRGNGYIEWREGTSWHP